MDVTRFDSLLALQLADTGGAIYTANMRQAAMSSAVRAFSRFRAFKRRYGNGGLYTAVAIGATSIQAVGGPFVVGAAIIIDAYSQWSETRTITAIARPTSSDELVGYPLTLTLSSALSLGHPAGVVISQATLGLQIAAGTDTYPLPYDFIEPERDSWDLATGARRLVKQQESFYDGVYKHSERIGGVGAGQSQAFAVGRPGFVGMPANGGLVGGVAGGGGPLYTFIDGQPPMLQVSPTPQASTTYDFLYIAQHLPANIPDSAMDALLDYAVAEALDARIAMLGQTQDERELDVSENPSSMLGQLRQQVQERRKLFDQKVRQLPLLTSG